MTSSLLIPHSTISIQVMTRLILVRKQHRRTFKYMWTGKKFHFVTEYISKYYHVFTIPIFLGNINDWYVSDSFVHFQKIAAQYFGSFIQWFIMIDTCTISLGDNCVERCWYYVCFKRFWWSLYSFFMLSERKHNNLFACKIAVL